MQTIYTYLLILHRILYDPTANTHTYIYQQMLNTTTKKQQLNYYHMLTTNMYIHIYVHTKVKASPDRCLCQLTVIPEESHPIRTQFRIFVTKRASGQEEKSATALYVRKFENALWNVQLLIVMLGTCCICCFIFPKTHGAHIHTHTQTNLMFTHLAAICMLLEESGIANK